MTFFFLTHTTMFYLTWRVTGRRASWTQLDLRNVFARPNSRQDPWGETGLSWGTWKVGHTCNKAGSSRQIHKIQDLERTSVTGSQLTYVNLEG